MKRHRPTINALELCIPLTGNVFKRFHTAMSLIAVPFYRHYLTAHQDGTTYIFVNVPRFPRQPSEIWPWLYSRISRLFIIGHIVSVIGMLIQDTLRNPVALLAPRAVGDLVWVAFLLLLARDGLRALKTAIVINSE